MTLYLLLLVALTFADGGMMVAANFQTKLWASCNPVLSPKPPAGGNTWAASPTSTTGAALCA
eukprot:scaffold28921_cov191-Amphora_coffeaeformis.AAC.9